MVIDGSFHVVKCRQANLSPRVSDPSLFVLPLVDATVEFCRDVSIDSGVNRAYDIYGFAALT
jgi:hypothetical protein